MDCPHCGSTYTTRLQRATDLDHAMFRYKECCRPSNERTGIPFNLIEVPTDIVL